MLVEKFVEKSARRNLKIRNIHDPVILFRVVIPGLTPYSIRGSWE
jgi:hypothetical protein